jgi:hypothetical protein
MKIKNLGILAITCVLMISTASQSSASDQRSPWDINSLSEISDPNLMRTVFGYYPVQSINDDFSWTVSLTDTKPYQLFQVLLSPCTTSMDVDVNYQACIEEVGYRKIGSDKWNSAIQSKFTLVEPSKTLKGKGGDLVVGKPVTLDRDKFRPAGDAASIWNLPSSRHAKGDTYMVRATINGSSAGLEPNSSFIPSRQFSFEILPVSFPINGNEVKQSDFKIELFPEGYEYKLRLKLGTFTKSMSGWFFGRIGDQTIDLNGSKGYLEVVGSPAKVPIGVTNVIKKSEIPQRLLDICAKLASDLNCDGNTANTFNRATLYAPDDGAEPGILSEYESVPGGVKTAASLTFWKLTSYFASTNPVKSNSTACLNQSALDGASSFLGVVSSNATMYQRTAPQWDDLNQTFSFKVSAPHLDEDGKENKGFYTLYIPIRHANCLWGVNASLPQAQVQILNQTGTSNITTAVAKQENGMLRFNISGFGYSSPTIRIKMGEGDFSPAKAPIPIKPLGAKKIVLICAKGKVLKQIVAVKPQCPAGYKKK